MEQSLDVFFKPKSIAVVGASRTPQRPGYCVVENLVRFGYEGKIYPINPNAVEILNLKAYSKITDIPGEVELVESLVSPQDTIKLLQQCAEKGVKGIIVTAGGFKEASEDGADLEREIAEIAKRNGIRILGPNVVGPLNFSDNFALCMDPLKEMKQGSVAFISQTSLFVTNQIDEIISSFGVSKCIDLGNKCDIDDAEALEYFLHDAKTKVIAIHIEGIKDGKRFIEVARRVSQEKPIIVFKTGCSEVSREAIASHTGSIMGQAEVYEAMFKQAGVISARSYREFASFIKAFAFYPPVNGNILRGNRIGMSTVAYGVSAMALDLFADGGLELAKLSRETVNKFKEITPQWSKAQHPLDLGVSLPLYGNKAYPIVAEALLCDENVDGVLLSFALNVIGGVYSIDGKDIERIVEVSSRYKKPLFVCAMGEVGAIKEFRNIAEGHGVPVYSTPEESVSGLIALWKYNQFMY